MSRTRQAFLLGRHLTEVTGVEATRTDQHGRRLRHLSEHDMARVLLAVELAPARDQPPRLAVIPAKEEA